MKIAFINSISKRIFYLLANVDFFNKHNNKYDRAINEAVIEVKLNIYRTKLQENEIMTLTP